jgi:DNA helicase-2/ATP-dependent DNA helicase PcrA
VAVDTSRLNPPQRAAVEHGGGPLLVLAGAGSGKTRVITYRIAHLLDLGIPPDAIAALTFTNKAAEEMRERVAHLLGNKKLASKLTMGTFHALGLTMLRAERKSLGYPKGFAVYDTADQLGVVRDLLRSLKDFSRDGERRWDVKAILTRISLAKNGFIAPEDYQPREGDEYDDITAQVYPRYQAALRAYAAFDFDDLIVEPVRLMQRDAAVADRWQGRYRFVLVDEFQDTNKAQLLMVRALIERHGNLTVVGDDDQSIYAWRGADPTNILRFAEMFEGATVVKLEQNYRSTRAILDAANAVIANNAQRHGKTLWSELGAGEVITHAVAQDVEQEAKWVAAEVKRVREAGRTWQDIAVLYRSNLQAKGLEDELRQNGIPYVMYGGQEFFERKEVKDVIAYLRLALNPRDELALRRVVNYPARGVGPATIEHIVATANERHLTMWDIVKLVDTEELGLRPGVRSELSAFLAILETLGNGLRAGHTVASTRALLDAIRLYDDLREASPTPTAAQRRIDNVEGLLNSLTRFEARAPGPDALADYLRKLSLESGEEADTSGDKIVLTTLHGAKGLEFPVVFMVGLEEELLPHARTLHPQATDALDADHASDVSEERRLCYVGITRAQRKLYITRACTRVSRGRPMQRVPSRFLLEIPDELLEVKDLAEEARQAVPTTELRSFFASFGADD